MRLLLKISFIILMVNSGFSQDNALHHRKYWWYKTRLNNDFVKVGRGDGESIPFMQRGVGSTSFSNPNADMLSGDATGLIGYYIATLATEYKLLKNNGQNTDSVKHELFCALVALNRLDYKAEALYSSGQHLLDGFFVRDDIPGNFTKLNYFHFNYYSTWDGNTISGATGGPNTSGSDRGFHSKLQTGIYKSQSTWKSFVEEGGDDKTAMESQDQVYNILLGLAFVNKYLPQSETDAGNSFGYGSGQASLRQEARNIATRIINHIRDPKNLSGNPCNTSGWNQAINQWRVKNSATCNLVAYGDDARAYAYPLAESECQITSNNYSAPALANLSGFPFACPGSGYHNLYSSGAGFQGWNTIATTPLYYPNQPWVGMDTRVFNTNLAAICNCVYGSVADQFVQQIITVLSQSALTNWLGIIIGWVYKLVTSTVLVFTPGFYKNITYSAIETNAYKYEAPLDHGPLAWALLHNNSVQSWNPQYTFDYLLDVAPCDGIYNFGISDQSHYQWSSDLRLDHPNRRGTDAGGDNDNNPNNGSPYAAKGEYNGIDYLLYHNLYYLHKSGPGGINVDMRDLSDVYINQSSFSNAGNVNAYETITIESTNLTFSTPTAWRAGKYIYFKPGTVITGNNNLHAYIQKFDCSDDYAIFRLANQDSSRTNEITEEDSYNNNVPYHHVTYPKDESSGQESLINNSTAQNLITLLPKDEYNKELSNANSYDQDFFVNPTITSGSVRTFFTLDPDEIAFISVMDLNGRKMYTNEGLTSKDSGLGIDLTSFASGTYLVKYTTTQGKSKTQKIIKQ